MLPQELEEEERREPLFPGQQGVLEFIEEKQAMDARDDNAINVAVIGPTGSGKSLLINRLFNLSVSKEGGSYASVTRNFKIYQGRGLCFGVEKTFNIIDTIGFCDSTFQPQEVIDLLKRFLVDQGTKIDRIIVVTAGRIERIHAESIKQIMKWTNFHATHNRNPRSRFNFIYNKTDASNLTEEGIQQNVLGMSTTLGTQMEALHFVDDEHNNDILTIPLNMPLGIPPDADFETTQAALEPVVLTMKARIEGPRIDVNTQACVIL